MLRRSFCCQHNKLTFSKSNWYNLALRAVLPEKRCLQRTIQIQYRATATLASALDEAAPSITSEMPLATPLEPLSLQETSEPTKVVRNKDSVSHLRRCVSYKIYSGQQCKRLFKVDPAFPEKEQRFCHVHDPKRQRPKETREMDQRPAAIKNIIVNESAFRGTNDKGMLEAPRKIYDCWELWVGDHIEPKRKSLIKMQMTSPLSNRDQPGYIYAYHLEDGPRVSQIEFAYFKIGRTKDPHRRMYQVTHACNYVPKIIELIPSFPRAAEKIKLETVVKKIKKVETPKSHEIPKCPMSHRVERLIHLELTSIHQSAGFKCAECGSTHREWIKVDRRKCSDGKLMTDRQLWESDIRPIVLKWVQFGVLASALQ